MSATDSRDGHEEDCASCHSAAPCDCGWTAALRIEEARAERDEAIAEATRLREREAHFAKVLGVADGGEYRNDWDSRIAAVVAERDRLTREVEAARQRAHVIAGAVPATWRNGSMAQRAAYRAIGEALREREPDENTPNAGVS